MRLLTLRPTGLSSPACSDLIDYIVIQDNRAVGRICEDCHTLPDRRLASKDPKSYGEILAARPRMSDSEAS
jgi:hypothetical protein